MGGGQDRARGNHLAAKCDNGGGGVWVCAVHFWPIQSGGGGGGGCCPILADSTNVCVCVWGGAIHFWLIQSVWGGEGAVHFWLIQPVWGGGGGAHVPSDTE